MTTNRRLSSTIHDVPVPWPKLRPRYIVTVGLRDTGSEYECVSFAVKGKRGELTINSGIVRDLPVGQLIKEAITQLLRNMLEDAEQRRAEQPDLTVFDGTPEGRPATAAEVSDFVQNRAAAIEVQEAKIRDMTAGATGKGTGRRYPAGHLELVAEIAGAARREGRPAAAAVADAFGVSKSAAGNQIGRARARGLLD